MRCFPLLLVLIGCSPPPTPPPCFTANNVKQLGPPIAVANQPTSVQIGLQVLRCDTQQTPLKSDLNTEILDPLNRSVAHTASSNDVLGSPANPINLVATLDFTPTMAGSYHVTVRFEPSLGIRQTDLIVAVDRTDAGFTTLKLPTPCTALEILPSGLTLCHTPPKLDIVPATGQSQTIEADQFFVSNELVWTSNKGDVRRWTSSATGLTLLQTVNPQLNTAKALVGTDDSVVLVTSEAIVVIRLTALGLTTLKTIQSSHAGNLAIAAAPGLVSVLIADDQFVCQVDLAGTLNDRCLPNTTLCTNGDSCGKGPYPLGSDSRGVWLGSEEGAQLASFRASPTEQFELRKADFKGIPKVGPQNPFFHFPGVAPVAPSFVLSRSADAITVDHVTLPEGFVMMPSTATRIRAQHADGRQLLWTR